MYAVSNPDLLRKQEFNVLEFPRNRLKVLEKLGEGQFGEVRNGLEAFVGDILGDYVFIASLKLCNKATA